MNKALTLTLTLTLTLALIALLLLVVLEKQTCPRGLVTDTDYQLCERAKFTRAMSAAR